MGSAPVIDYLIVGAGVFGASTALYLAQTKPSAQILLIDRSNCPCPSAASSDVNKIVRADYDDAFYMRLALEAVERWRHDPLYRPFYHQTGMLFAENVQQGHKILKNYKALGTDTRAEILHPDHARAQFPCFAHANWTGVCENYYNPGSGWAEADGALTAVLSAALAAGIRFLPTAAATLCFDAAGGTCTGVRTADGQVLDAEHVLLCTGARTAQLLADSAPGRPELQIGHRMVAAAATSVLVACEPAHRPRYRDAPVHFIGMQHTRGESVPMDARGRLKFNLELSVTNLQKHEASGQTISVPPGQESRAVWSQDVPGELNEAVRRVVRNVYGPDAPGLSVEAYRLCWDAVTPNQDFVIAPHPACRRLYVAGGGSFHGWKFLPVIGKYVVSMLDGELEEECARRWAWDRPNDGAACSMYIPQHDLKDFR